MHARDMFGLKNCRLARMSSGRYCLIRDLGPVKGGKGLRHHEVLIAFSVQAVLKRVRPGPIWLKRHFRLKRFHPAPQLRAREVLGK
jgi:hypothetical protein